MLCYSKRNPESGNGTSLHLALFRFIFSEIMAMKISISALLLPAALARGGSVAVAPITDPTATISARLLGKAVPLQEYQSQHPNDESLQRQLANNDNNGDNYYVTSNSYDFASYSLKYTTCQRVQHFSSEAIGNGESSPLVTTDIVLLRLCPERRCGANSEMGCSVGWGDYVLSLDEYVRIMTNYELDKQRNLCGLCEACQKGYGDFYYSGYRYNNGGRQRSRQLEDVADAGDDDAATDDAVAAYDDDYTEGGTCYTNSALCHINEESCANLDAGGDENENGYASYSDFLNYLGCVEVKDGMYINARCDSDSNKIGWGYSTTHTAPSMLVTPSTLMQLSMKTSSSRPMPSKVFSMASAFPAAVDLLRTSIPTTICVTKCTNRAIDAMLTLPMTLTITMLTRAMGTCAASSDPLEMAP